MLLCEHKTNSRQYATLEQLGPWFGPEQMNYRYENALTYTVFASTGPGANKSGVIVGPVYLHSVLSGPAVRVCVCGGVCVSFVLLPMSFPHIVSKFN